MTKKPERKEMAHRLAWFFALWLAGVIAVAILATAIKFVLKA